jgi:DNA-binding transcriptional ArsR family regulator
MNKDDDLLTLAEKVADIFSIFSNAKRVLIFWALEDRELSVNEIARVISASIQNTSQHLRLMKSRGILATRRQGQTIFYRIADNPVGRFCSNLQQDKLKVLN